MPEANPSPHGHEWQKGAKIMKGGYMWYLDFGLSGMCIIQRMCEEPS